VTTTRVDPTVAHLVGSEDEIGGYSAFGQAAGVGAVGVVVVWVFVEVVAGR
jgi:hypothetical protein